MCIYINLARERKSHTQTFEWCSNRLNVYYLVFYWNVRLFFLFTPHAQAFWYGFASIYLGCWAFIVLRKRINVPFFVVALSLHFTFKIDCNDMLSGYCFDWHNNSQIPYGCILNEILKWNENTAFIWHTHSPIQNLCQAVRWKYFCGKCWIFGIQFCKIKPSSCFNVYGKFNIQFQYDH